MTGMPEGMTLLGGTFTFQEGEDYILIGTARYEKYEGENETGAVNEAPSDETNSSVQPAQTPDTELKVKKEAAIWLLFIVKIYNHLKEKIIIQKLFLMV